MNENQPRRHLITPIVVFGITALIAVVMLFFMSYWLLSKVESRRWKAWLEGKLTHSLSRGSLVGLWLTSFLAVYREGAETVLFYYALVGDAQSVSGHLAIGAGFVIGCVLLLAAMVVVVNFVVDVLYAAIDPRIKAGDI